MQQSLSRVALTFLAFGMSAALVWVVVRAGQPAPPPAAAQQAAAQKDAAQALSESFADAVERALPSVVSIHVERERTVNETIVRGGVGQVVTPRTVREPGIGSGVVISPEGHIATNWHVVEDAVEIEITLHAQDEPRRAVLVDRDEDLDVALLRLEPVQPGEVFYPLPFGDSDTLRPGNCVIALGSPLNMRETATLGIISNRSRSVSDTFTSFLQTDCVINPGNSGGPLINLKGELIGINTRLIIGPEDTPVGQGYGLALPGNEVQDACDRILNKGKPRGYLGVSVDNYPTDSYQRMEKPDSVVVLGVEAGSPAAAAGLKKDDIVRALDGQPVRNVAEFFRRLRNKQIGENVVITLLREGRAAPEITATIGDLKTIIALEEMPLTVIPGGLTVREIRRVERRRFHLREGMGLYIEDVSPRSPFHEILKRGDIILGIAEQLNTPRVITVDGTETLRIHLERLEPFGGYLHVFRDRALVQPPVRFEPF